MNTHTHTHQKTYTLPQMWTKCSDETPVGDEMLNSRAMWRCSALRGRQQKVRAKWTTSLFLHGWREKGKAP